MIVSSRLIQAKSSVSATKPSISSRVVELATILPMALLGVVAPERGKRMKINVPQ